MPCGSGMPVESICLTSPHHTPSHNRPQFEERAAQRLAEHLPSNLSILSLNLNMHGNTFLLACPFARLEAQLVTLNLPSNHIDVTGLMGLVAAFKAHEFAQLSRLNLAGNLIEDEPMMRLYEVQ